MLLPNLEKITKIPTTKKTQKKLKKTNLIKILPNLYISDHDSTSEKEILKKKNISIIFNLTKKNCKNYHKNFQYENYNISDNGNINNKILFKKIIKKINFYKEIKNKGVVVQCYKGISRAPTVVIGYLMVYEGFCFERAFDFVKDKKNDIDPNFGFLIQLMDFFN